MSYRTLMVHLKVGSANNALLQVARDLADKFDAKVIGIAACQPTPMVYNDGFSASAIVDLDRTEIERERKAAETEFRSVFQSLEAGVEWRSAVTFETIADHIARASGEADLIITRGLSLDAHDTARPDKPGNIVMQAGRPVLVVPRTANALKLDHIVVAWKNTREARRAVADALPLLAKATHVTVLHIAHESEREQAIEQLSIACNWLKTHNIVAEPNFIAFGQGDDAFQLNAAIEALGADVVVAGAYGHSRLREWALGGVTRDLTLQAEYCTLLSH